jgi:hypothetical protein
MNNPKKKLPLLGSDKSKSINYRFYDGWKAVGRYVRKGEKAYYRNKAGIPMFHISQTEVIKPYRFFSQPHDAYDSLGITAHDMGADF